MIYVFCLFVFKRSFQNSLEFYINKNFTSTTGSAASLDKIQMLVFGFVFQQHMERRRKERKAEVGRRGEGRGAESGASTQSQGRSPETKKAEA